MRLITNFSVLGALFLLSSPSLALDWFGETLEGQPCTGNVQAFGPYDFFEVDEPTDVRFQEGRWWEARVVHAEPGLGYLNSRPFDQGTYNRAAQEFDYLLRAYPNQPQILQAVIELEFKRREASGVFASRTPPECYLQRAMAFRPEQPHLYQLMGMYLQRLGRVEEALGRYERALELDPDSAEVMYNMGLAHLELRQYDEALEYARQAYALGFPLPGLRARLRRLNVWED